MYKSDYSCFVETYLKDHLGNIRVAFGDEMPESIYSNFGIRQVNAYYPFGMNINTLSENRISKFKHNENLYNGKMFQDELGLNWLDYGARFYDPVIGRWHSVDPLAEIYLDQSPYIYCSNNPLNRIDPSGMSDGWVEDPTDPSKGVRWEPGINNEDEAISAGLTYIGQTTLLADQSGDVKYGAQDGLIYEMAALSEVEIDGGELSDHAKTMNNPLTKEVHNAQKDMIRGSAELTSHLLGSFGDGATYLGTTAMAIPGAQGVGGVLIGAGAALGSISTGIDMGLNVADREWGKLITNTVAFGLTKRISRGMGTLRLTNGETDFLKGALESSVSIFKGFTNMGFEKQKNKKEKK